MPKEYSPFTPGRPVPIEFFVGRVQELEKIISSVRKSCSLPTVEALFVHGERGIGKSSLCRVAVRAAERDPGVLGLHVFLGGVKSLEEMVRRVFERLLQESIDRPWYDSVKKFLGNHVRQVGLFGLSVEFHASKEDLSKAVGDFVPALRNLLKQIGGTHKGILLVLDDINGLSGDSDFANWLKSIIDEIATGRDPLPFTLVLVGLPERRHQLIQNQPSLDRVFDLIQITRFDEAETRDFYTKAFSKVGVTVKDEAHRLFWLYTGGFPVFMHEIGDAAYQVDTDNTIDKDDALLGVVRAARIIGAKYIEPKVMAAIRSEKYRSILNRIVRGEPKSEFTRQEILEHLAAPQKKVFDNFLRRMRELGVIRANKEKGAGYYEFTTELYAVFFWLQAAVSKRKA
jgi:AAA+ ATPase superfamily predicted ATPase